MGAGTKIFKNEIGDAKNRVRGTVNIFKKKGTLKEKFSKADRFNEKTRGLTRDKEAKVINKNNPINMFQTKKK